MLIQTELKAPKNLFNKFGGYKYRNAEGICEAVKPYLAEYNCALVLGDEVLECGGRVYIKSIARLYDVETKQEVYATAMAREAESKKGMDDSQITGTATSYARKYALNGLFLLDDTKDADTEESRTERIERAKEQELQDEAEKIAEEKISPVMVDALKMALTSNGVKESQILSHFNIEKLEDMNTIQYRETNDMLEKLKKEKKK